MCVHVTHAGVLWAVADGFGRLGSGGGSDL